MSAKHQRNMQLHNCLQHGIFSGKTLDRSRLRAASRVCTWQPGPLEKGGVFARASPYCDGGQKRLDMGRNCHAGVPWISSNVTPGLRRATMQGGLVKLATMIASMSRERRRVVIEGLSVPLRIALAGHMEANLASGRVHLAHGQDCSIVIQVSDKDTGALEVTAQQGKQMSQGAIRGRCGKGQGGVCTIRLAGSCKYFARITIDGIAINSRCTSEREEANRLQCLLASAREQSASTPSRDAWLRTLFSQGEEASSQLRAGSGSLQQLPPELQSLRAVPWRFRALVDARAWAGQILSTRVVGTVAEALLWRQRLDAARLRGWVALRDAWAQCMPQVRRDGLANNFGDEPRKAGLSALSLRYLATQARRAGLRNKRNIIAASRAEARLIRLASKLERALIAEAARTNKRKRITKDEPHNMRRKGSPPLLPVYVTSGGC